MSSPKRNRARILTASGLKKLREQMRSHEVEENAGFKYTLERLGELTGLDPETVKNVLDCKGSDKRTIARCFETFGLALVESDHVPAAQATTTADPNFVGRDEAIADLDTLVSRNARVIVIQARGGVGKTTLARKYLQQAFGSFLEFPIAKETKDIASIEGLLEEKLRQLGEEPGREFLVSLDRLKRKLQADRIGILIDNLEPALDSAGKFIEAHRRYVELLRVLSDPTVQSTTLITSRERLREADVTVQHYPLRSLAVTAWEQFFQSRNINTETPALAALHNAYGGNAKAMDIISGAVLEDFSGNVEAYWQANQDDLFIERDLEDLVAKQFDRLQELDSDAYKLLCRMGCYRYQDVPTVPIEGLFCLLWDVPENRHRRVIKSLQDRSLVDFEDREFWVHPVIRAEAILRLKVSQEWLVVNKRIAEFWAEHPNERQDLMSVLRAFESYHYYVNVEELDNAAAVITKPFGHAFIGDDLGSCFYRFGLLNQMKIAIESIKSRIRDPFSLTRLNLILGYIYNLTGCIHEGIKCHKESIRVASDYLESESSQENEVLLHIKYLLERTYIYGFHNIGLCKMDLWELEEAEEYFLNFLKLVKEKDLKDREYFLDAYYCLALVKSHMGNNREATSYAEKAFELLGESEWNKWGTGFSLLFLGATYKNLNELDKACLMYHSAIDYAARSNYDQVRAKALVGLAEIHRDKRDFKYSFSFHALSIDLLKKIEVKCDLAEGYYQLGLTHQAKGEFEKSNENFQEAIQLFTEMKAPKQVERVKRSMHSSQ